MHQLSKMTYDKGALIHDDIVDCLAMVVEQVVGGLRAFETKSLAEHEALRVLQNLQAQGACLDTAPRRNTFKF